MKIPCTPHTTHGELHIMHSTLCNVQYTVYTTCGTLNNGTLYIDRCMTHHLCTMHYTEYNTHTHTRCTNPPYNENFDLKSILISIYSTHHTLYPTPHTVYSIHCTLCATHTPHSTILAVHKIYNAQHILHIVQYTPSISAHTTEYTTHCAP